MIRNRNRLQRGQLLIRAALASLLGMAGTAHAWPFLQVSHPMVQRNAALQARDRGYTFPVQAGHNEGQAAPDHTHAVVVDTPPHRAPQQQRHRTAADAARWAKRANGGGRVLAVYPSDTGYRVKLLKDGEVSVVDVPN